MFLSLAETLLSETLFHQSDIVTTNVDQTNYRKTIINEFPIKSEYSLEFRKDSSQMKSKSVFFSK